MAGMEQRNADEANGAVEDLIPIGRFARLTGLSIGALRHYDELDLLRPADVDRFTGYRRYRPGQIEIARTIGRLRDLELPLEAIREVLATDDPAGRRALIGTHEQRLQAQVDRLSHLLHVTRQLSHGKEPIVSELIVYYDELTTDQHRRLAKELFNQTWTLIEKADRTPAEIDEMLHATHASAWHWSMAGGTLANAARGEWQAARVYATLGRGEPALWHANRCLELAEAAVETGVADDWDIPAALEGLARAQAVAGDRAAAAATVARARSALERIADPEDRQLIGGDLDTIPM